MKEKENNELGQLTDFVMRFSIDNLPETVVGRLKIHLLDALGCAIGALDGLPIQMQRKSILNLGGNPQATVIGTGIRSAVDRAAQHATALIRYLDFMDNFVAQHGTCHPSDNIGSILAVCDWRNSSGRSLLEGIALAYYVQCHMIEAEPSMDKGFDHTTQLAYSISAGVSKVMKLDREKTLNAISLSGSTFNPLVVIRAPHTSQWKGLISSHVAFGTVNCCLLAECGITAPRDVFTGAGGYNEDFGIKNPVEWEKTDPELYKRLDIKKHNAEIHTQTAIEACLLLRKKLSARPEDVEHIALKTFKTAYDITGGGKYGPRDKVFTKEDADHSLPYLLAVALIDGEVQPEQFVKERIQRDDVQHLLKKVNVSMKVPLEGPRVLVETLDPYTREFPEKMMCSLTLKMKDGRKESCEIGSYPGFYLEPVSWDDVVSKFHSIAGSFPLERRNKIISLVADILNVQTRELVQSLDGIL
jgi:2-methylcitrate dehydratase